MYRVKLAAEIENSDGGLYTIETVCRITELR